MASFNSSTLLDNWAEERSLRDLKMVEYVKRKEAEKEKERSGVHVANAQSVLSMIQAATELTQLSLITPPPSATPSSSSPPSTPLLYGNSFLLQSVSTSSILSVSPFDPAISNNQFLYKVSASPLSSTSLPMQRNTWRILPYVEVRKGRKVNDRQLGDVVRYGDLIRLEANRELFPSVETNETAFHLTSQPLDTLTSGSSSQLCGVGLSSSFDSVWRIEAADIKGREDVKGEVIAINNHLGGSLASSSFVLFHGPTLQCLGCTSTIVHNDFGGENEVVVKTMNSMGRYEMTDLRHHKLYPRGERAENWWRVLGEGDIAEDGEVKGDEGNDGRQSEAKEQS